MKRLFRFARQLFLYTKIRYQYRHIPLPKEDSLILAIQDMWNITKERRKHAK